MKSLKMSSKTGVEYDHTLSISHLPEEILLKIFAYVSRFDIFHNIRNVCQEWKLLSECACLWKSVDLAREKDELIKNWLEIISCNILYLNTGFNWDRFTRLLTDNTYSFQKVTTLCVTIDKSIELKSVMKTIEISYPNLQILHLNVCDITHEDMFKNSSFMSFIRSIDRVGFRFYDFPFTDLTNFLECLSNLISFEVCILSDDALKMLLTNCRRLEKLNLNGCCYIKCDDFNGIPKHHMLISLNVSSTYLEDKGLDIITQNTPNLRYLYVYDCAYITDIGFSHVGNNCSKLEVLEISEYSYSTGRNMTNVGLDAVATGCKNLQVLVANFCQGITDLGVQSIVEHCPNISTLKLSGCTGITDKGLESLGKCRLLHYAVFDECLQVTDKGVNMLIGNCIWLQTVRFNSCNLIHHLNFGPFMQISNTNVTSKHKNCDVRNSRIATISETCDDIGKTDNLSHDFEITDDDLVLVDSCGVSTDTEAICENIHDCMTNNLDTVCFNSGKILLSKVNMEDEDVSRTPQIAKTSENTLESVVKQTERIASLASDTGNHFNWIHHSHLRKLYLNFCGNITNDSVKQIADFCPDLRLLYFTGTYLITDSSIQYLLKKCTQLQALDISGGSTLGPCCFTDDVLVSAANDGKALKRLTIQKNYNITKTGISDLLWTSQSLEKLSFNVYPANLKGKSNNTLIYGEIENLLQEFGKSRPCAVKEPPNPPGGAVVKIEIYRESMPFVGHAGFIGYKKLGYRYFW